MVLMRPPMLLVLLLGLLSQCLCAQTTDAQAPGLHFAEPASVGCDAEALARAAKLISDLVDADKLRGAVVMVVRGDAIVLHQASGARDVAGKQAMKKDTLFRMASNTKAVTAAAVLSLVDEGKVGLDDAIARFLPEWSKGDAKKITVRQLLTHSSGLRIGSLFLRPLLEKSKQHPDAPNLVLECARFGEVGPEVTPGTSYSYSNPGYNTLAALVEIVSGQGFEAYCKQRFYEPLGMRDTCNHESRADHSRMSVVVRGRALGRWNARWSPGDEPDLPFVRGSGGMISTAPDFAKFCRMILAGGKVGDRRLLSAKSVAAATRNQIQQIKGGRYGFGWTIDAAGAFSHGGSDGTWAWCDPARDLVGMVFTQTQSSSALNEARIAFRRGVTAACPQVENGSK